MQTSSSVHERVNLWRVLAALFFSLTGMALVVGVLLVEGGLTAVLGLLLLATVSWVFLLWHRRSFEHGHFDLVRFSGEQ